MRLLILCAGHGTVLAGECFMLQCDYEKSRQLQQTPGVQFPNNLLHGDFSGNMAQHVERVKAIRGQTSASITVETDKVPE